MAKRIIWNNIALKIFEGIIDYNTENYSEKVASDFINKVIDRLNILSRYPDIGRKSKKKENVKFYKIDKDRDLYYRIDEDNLIVIYIFDTRQDPNKNPY